MCVAFWTLDHPDYALILCSNRDEYFDRPTKTAHWHSFDQPQANPTVLSGIDIVAGGTWLGINETGNIAVLTNITEPRSNMSSSRGHLCSSFLLHPRYGPEVTLDQYAKELTTAETPYSGFNLLLLSPSKKSESSSSRLQYDFTILSNGGAGGMIEQLKPSSDSSCFGISNGSPNGVDPFTSEQKNIEWAKVTQGRQLLHDTISARAHDEAELVEGLFRLLRTKQGPPPSCRTDFQRNIIIDSVDLAEMRRGASFQSTERGGDNQGTMKESTHVSRYYATRLATVILVRRNGEVTFVERDVWYMESEPRLRDVGDDRYDRRHNFRIDMGN